MTRLGEYFAKRSVNRAGVARRTGLRTQRLNELCNNSGSNLRANELYLIAKAIGVNPCELLEFVCQELELTETS